MLPLLLCLVLYCRQHFLSKLSCKFVMSQDLLGSISQGGTMILRPTTTTE
jgi:hypothetical protein